MEGVRMNERVNENGDVRGWEWMRGWVWREICEG